MELQTLKDGGEGYAQDGARMLTNLRGSIPDHSSWMLYSNDDELLESWILLEEADLEHGLEHVVSISYRANPGESPKDTRRNGAAEPQRRSVPVETSTLNALISQCDGVGSYDWSFQAEEEPTNYALTAFSSSSSSSDNKVASCSKAYTKEYATLQSHYDKLTEDYRKSQFDVISYQTGLESVEFAPSPIYDRYQSGNGYHVVPLPYTGTFMPPKPDFVFNNAPNDVETDHSTFTVKHSPTKPDQDLSHTNRPSAPIIEDWVSDSEKTSIPTATSKTAIPKPTSNGKHRNRKACFVCKCLDHLIKDYDYHEKKIAQTTRRNNSQRGTHKQYAHMTLPNPQMHTVLAAIFTQFKPVPITAVRLVTTAVPKTSVPRPRHDKHVVTKTNSLPKRLINRSPSPKASNSTPRVTVVKAPMVNDAKGNPQHTLKDKGVIDSGCSWDMTGNMSYLSDFEELNGGYFTFGGNPKGGKISGKGKIRTGKLDFDDVYFVKELKFNLFSVSQMCDKKNSVLFTDSECLVLSPEFKLPDENQVLLRVPRENNMYNVNLKNIVPSGDLTCLFAKEKLDESNLWHRRLSHMNFKTMNKLVKGNLVKGAIGTKWVFKNKKDERGILVRNKARLVAQGHAQEEEINYEEVFAPAARIETIRLFLAYASFVGFMVYQMDVKSAFLYGTIEEEVYVCQPLGFEDPDYPNKVYKVVKALYGLHQAPKALTDGKSASTPIDTEKPLLKDPDGCSKWHGVFEKDGTSYKYLKCWFTHLTTNGSQFTLSNPHQELASPDQTVSGVNTPRCDEDRLELMELTVFLLPSDEKVGVKTRRKAVITKASIRDALHLDDAEELARMGYEKPSTKLTFYKAFFPSQWKFLIHTILQCMSAKRTSWNEFSSSMASTVICLSSGRKFNFSKYIFDSLVRNVDSPTKFYMYPRFLQLMIRKQVGDLSSHSTKYTSPALTQNVFANMRQVGNVFLRVETPLFEGMIVEQQVDEGDVEVNVDDVPAVGVPVEGDVSAADVVPTADEEPSIPSPKTPTPPPQPSQDKLERRNKASKLKRLKKVVMDDVSKHGGIIANIDANEDVVLEDAKDVAADAKDGQDVDIDESAEIQGRTTESQAQIYQIDLEHGNKVLSMQEEEESEPDELQEVVDVVTTSKIITKVVTAASDIITAASTTITAADVLIPAATTVAAPTLTAAPSKRRNGVVIRDPQETTTISIIIHSEAKSKDKGKWILVEEPKPLKKQVQIKQDEKYARELEAELNKNIDWDEVTDHMDYFKGTNYDDIRPIFEKHFNSNVAFLLKTKEQIDEEESRALKRLNESKEDKAAKKQKLDEEVEELKRHLQIVPNDEDGVYTEATPLARKVPVVDYEIYNENSKPYYKIKRANEVKSWKLLESCGVQIITFTTTQLILLVEMRYPLTRFTLDQMLNNVQLEIEEESEVSLELLSSCFHAPPSPDYVPVLEYPPLPEFVPKAVYPEFRPAEDDILPAEEQPLPAASSPTTESDLDENPEDDPKDDPEEDPEDDPEEDPADYPTDGGDKGDDEYESSNDDEDDDIDIKKDKEEDEYLAPVDSTAVALPAIDHAPSAEPQTPISLPSDTEIARHIAIPTSPPSPLSPLSSPLPQIPSPPLPLLSPPPTDPTYEEAPLGYRVTRLRWRAEREEIPEADLPLRKRLCTTHNGTYELGESSAAAAARLREPFRDDIYRFMDTVERGEGSMHAAMEVGHGIIDTWDDLSPSPQVIQGLRYHDHTARLIEGEAMASCTAWTQPMDASDAAYSRVIALHTKVSAQRTKITDLRAADYKFQTTVKTQQEEIKELRATHRKLQAQFIQALTKMAPKRTTRANPATTTTTITTSMTDAQLETLIKQGVAKVLAVRDADRNTNGDDSHVSGTCARRMERVTRECTYLDFMK
nr:ribonuclease H-like domain-containing protein [Tanacetum cinerariifolium]